MDSKSTLVISAEDTDAARLLVRALAENGYAVGVLGPIAFPPEKFNGATPIDARRIGEGHLRTWFEGRLTVSVVDLGALSPESIELLHQAHGDQIDHYVFCSSTSVYASGLSAPVAEDAPLAQSDTPLIAVERYLAKSTQERPFPTTILRSTPVFGEGRGMLSYFLDRLLFGEGILCPRAKDDVIQPLYIGDWIETLLALLRKPPEQGGVFNLAGHGWVSISEFLEGIAAAAYTDPQIYYYSADQLSAEQTMAMDPFPLPGAGHEVFSTLRLAGHLGIEPHTPVADGLEQGFVRYLEQAEEIPEPRLAVEGELIRTLGLRPEAEPEPLDVAPAPSAQTAVPAPQKPIAGKLGAPTKMGLGVPRSPAQSGDTPARHLGAPTRLGKDATLGPIRRPRDPSEFPIPGTSAPEVVEQRLDSMVDLMLSGVNREGENEMQVEMKDEVLGGLHIKIAQKNREIRARFGCKRRESRATIEENFPSLRRKLETRGYFVLELAAVVLS